MSGARRQDGFSLIEMLVSLTILGLMVGGIAGLLVHNSQINRREQISAEAQANARNCLSMIVQVLRSAGWDPRNAGLATVALDPDPTDAVDTLEVFTDINEDGDTDDPDEQILIRHVGQIIEWRKSSDTSQPFVILADNISNDRDGDGIVETMFVPDSISNPTSIVVQITAQSPGPDPRSGDFIRYTVASEVVLRRNL